MAVDPIARVIAPRFWAGVISMPLLAAMFSAMGVFGGYLVGVVLIGEADTVGSNHIAQSKVLVERIPGAKMKVLNGQSHGVFWQAAEKTNAVILDWVKKHSVN